MREIKNKKQIILTIGIVSIAIIIFAPSVSGYFGVKFPYMIIEIEGESVSGDITSFQGYEDGNIYKYVGEGGFLHPLSFTTFFEAAGNVGDGNSIVIHFRNYGWCVITMTVYYSGGGGARYYIVDTHGMGDDGFVTEYIDIPIYKIVHSINFAARNFWGTPEIEIDYLGAHYF